MSTTRRLSRFGGPRLYDDYERCYFDLLSRPKWKEYKTLGSVLDAQLVHKGKTTRSTQTNWKWREMAERWRHATVLEPTEIVLSKKDSESIDLDMLATINQNLNELRRVRSRDKIVDTTDLEYDPYNLDTEYKHRFSTPHAKYIPPAMKETIKNYGRKWMMFTAMRCLSVKRRHKIKGELRDDLLKDSGFTVNVQKMSRSVQTRRPIRDIIKNNLYNMMK